MASSASSVTTKLSSALPLQFPAQMLRSQSQTFLSGKSWAARCQGCYQRNHIITASGTSELFAMQSWEGSKSRSRQGRILRGQQKLKDLWGKDILIPSRIESDFVAGSWQQFDCGCLLFPFVEAVHISDRQLQVQSLSWVETTPSKPATREAEKIQRKGSIISTHSAHR